MATERVVVIGAGIGGLAAALRLAARGLDVVVVERTDGPGGKMRPVSVAGCRLDAGPTVFTMRWVFDELFAAVGKSLDDHVALRPAELLARHAWDDGGRLDLFADAARSADAIGAFAGPAAAERFRAFCARARAIYTTLEAPFITAARPSPLGLVRAGGIAGLPGLLRIDPFTSLWRALGDYFHDPRLRQLFGRYATYCGSSPFAAPATLMLVAHVEQSGVWLVDGGMGRLPQAIEAQARDFGAVFRYAAPAAEILVAGGRTTGVRLADGERIAADAVVLNADVSALGAGLLGTAVAKAAPATSPGARSLSAVTWAMQAETEGFPLSRHTVFFGGDYAGEFDDLMTRRRFPRDPTVYVCAQDRGARDGPVDRPECPERLLCLVNAPAVGDRNALDPQEIALCESRTFERLARCGLRLMRQPAATLTTTPREFEAAYPGTGGALYGPASHGWRASFSRSGSRTRVAGLYLAGGSVHPGPGMPMAALSGRLAAESLLADLASTSRSRPAATRGGISTRSARTDARG